MNDDFEYIEDLSTKFSENIIANQKGQWHSWLKSLVAQQGSCII